MQEFVAGQLQIRVHPGTILCQLLAEVGVRIFLIRYDLESEFFRPANLLHSNRNRCESQLLVSQLLHRWIEIPGRRWHGPFSKKKTDMT